MTGITTEWQVTRTSLSLGNLVVGSETLLAPDGSGVVTLVPKGSIDLGDSGWRQTLVKSPYVPGAVEVHAVLDIVQGKFGWWAKAADYPTLLTRRAEVITAFRQASYSLLWSSSDGGSQSFACLRAAVQMAWNEDFSYGVACGLVFKFLRQPNQSDY